MERNLEDGLMMCFQLHAHKMYRPGNMTELTLTTVFEEAEEGGFIGYAAELPGANT